MVRRARPKTVMEKIIEIANATVYRGETKVLENLSLEIALHTSTVILGPNGSGKSTLLKLLAHEVYPVVSNGSYVQVFGQTHWNLWELRARLGIISSDLQYEYEDYVTGEDVILSGLYSSIGVWPNQEFSRKDQERALQILKTLGAEHLQNRPYRTLSTGEQRRLLLGRALIHNPEALVLDEPTSGLDLQSCFQYLNIVRGLIRAGKTIVLVTHHLHEIPPEIFRVVLLKAGTIVASGAKQELLSSERLSRLYGIPMQVRCADGFYWATPESS
jgi:iron complex transport system ATP-binding protein